MAEVDAKFAALRQSAKRKSRLRRLLESTLLAPFYLVAVPYIAVLNAIQRRTALRAFGDSLNAIAAYRDGALLLVACAYLLGYAVWSFHAWQEGLGLLPALRFQYLLAGAVPLSLGLLLVGFFVAVNRIESVRQITIVLVAVVLTTILLSALVFPSLLGKVGLWSYIGLTAFVFATGLAFPMIGLAPIAVPWMALSVVFLGAVLYVSVLYPAIPQEFGGVRPRCAYLDLKTAEVSPDTLKKVAGSYSASARAGAATTDPSGIATTDKLSLLFVGSDFMLVRRREVSSGQASSVYEIKEASITGLKSCE